MLKISSLLPALAAFTFAVSADAGGKIHASGKPDLGFHALGPGGLKINGTSGELEVIDDGKKLVLKAPLKNLKTGISLRDKHTQKYLNTDKFPAASLTVDRSALKFPDDEKEVSGAKATGAFRLNGVTKDVSFTYSAKRKNKQIFVDGKTKVNIEDFKIEKPCYLGVCVDSQVEVVAKFTVEEKDEK